MKGDGTCQNNMKAAQCPGWQDPHQGEPTAAAEAWAGELDLAVSSTWQDSEATHVTEIAC